MVYILAGSLFLLIVRPYENYSFLGDLHLQRFYLIFMLIAFAAYPRKKIKMDATVLLFYWFWFALCVSAVLGIDFETSYTWIYAYTTESLVFVLMFYTLYDEKSFIRINELMLLITALYVLLSFREFLGGRFDYAMGMVRMVGYDITYGQSNSFATTIVLSYPLLWLFLKTDVVSKMVRYGLYGYIPLSLFCLFETGSRGGFVQCAAFVTLLFWKSRRKFLYVVLIMVAFFAVWHIIPVEMQNRYYSLIDSSAAPNAASAHESAEGRIVGFKHGVSVWKDNPLFGIGPGNLIYTWPGQTLGHQAHNLAGQLLSDIGLFGTIPFVLLFSLCYFRSKWIARVGGKLTDAYRRQPGMEREAKVVDFVSKTGIAVKQLLIVLFVAGLTSHNMLRYQWVYVIYLTVIATGLTHKYIKMRPDENESDEAEPSETRPARERSSRRRARSRNLHGV
jgi:O-antigen ligase